MRAAVILILFARAAAGGTSFDDIHARDTARTEEFDLTDSIRGEKPGTWRIFLGGGASWRTVEREMFRSSRK